MGMSIRSAAIYLYQQRWGERVGRRRRAPSQRGANGSTDVVESGERIECDVSDPQHNALFHELVAMHIVVIHLA